jgi:hypothetical protein
VTGYADPTTGLVRLQVMTYISEAGDYQLEALVDTEEGPNAVQYRRALYLAPGQQTHELAFVVPNPRPWSPAAPALYEVEVNLRQGSELLDRVYFNIGFRSLEAQGNQLLLNGEAVYLDGVLFQPYYGDSFAMSYEQLRDDLEYTRDVTGCNLLRIHIAGADPLPLYLADELGLLVWVEVPSPHVSNEASRANHRRELESLLRQIDTHPCVALVSLYNESWGCQDIAEDSAAGAATRAYIKEAYRYIRQTRPDLLVVENDGWEHLCEGGELIATDFISLHVYINELAEWEKVLANIAALFEKDNPRYRELTGHRPTVCSDYRYHGEKPIIISEWGGFGALYGGPAAQREKFELIRRYKAALHQHRAQIAGDCYTQLGDVEQETNGLLDKARQGLSDPQFLKLSAGLLGPPEKL